MKRLGLVLVLFFFPVAVMSATFNVDVVGLSFNPPSLSVNPGDTVNWRFQSPNHTTTSNATTGAETWNSGVVAPGGTFAHTFSVPGNHPYYCAIHSSPNGTMMNGVIVVNAPAPPPPPPGPSIPTASTSVLILMVLTLAAIGLVRG